MSDRKEYMKKYYEENKEELNAYRKQYYEANKKKWIKYYDNQVLNKGRNKND